MIIYKNTAKEYSVSSEIDNRTHLIYKSKTTQTEIDLFDYKEMDQDVLIDITWLGIVVLLILVTEYEWFEWVLQVCYWILPV